MAVDVADDLAGVPEGDGAQTPRQVVGILRELLEAKAEQGFIRIELGWDCHVKEAFDRIQVAGEQEAEHPRLKGDELKACRADC
jgi:hypothetical protein